MKHTKLIFAIAFTVIIILTACSHKSTPTAAATPTPAAPKEAPAQFNMMTAAAGPSVVEGEKVYNAKCGKCHDLKKPSEYTAREWTSIMRSMAPKAKLNDVEKSDVMAFVANGARGK